MNSSVSRLYHFGYKLTEGCSSLSTHRQETRNLIITLEV